MALERQAVLAERARDLVEAGRVLYARGWVPATSGNLSARLDEAAVAVTVSGRHKGRLTTGDIIVVDMEGQPLDPADRPSAETGLHVALYRRFDDVGAVLHTHSVGATLVSRMFASSRGVSTHETRVSVPIFPNDQDMTRLGRRVDAYLDTSGPVYGYLIKGHGLYTWGHGVEEALCRVEAFEFLFECEVRMRDWSRA
jgi:methylthioribulose-1-phosphate dehydratase